jgi:hypothetical protein
MKYFAFALLLVLVSPETLLAAQARAVSARDLVEAALSAQGGADRLRSLATVRLHAMTLTNALEQSVRPEGPWVENYSAIVETRRFSEPALRTETRSRGYNSSWWTKAEWAESTSLVSGGASFTVRGGALAPAAQGRADLAEEALALGPEQALLTALAAPDLKLAPKARLRDQLHDVVSFTWKNAPVRIMLTPLSHMPAAVEIVRPRPLETFWSPWGDVTTRVEWDHWTVEKNGIRYPRRWTIRNNGQIEQSRMIDQIDFNPEMDPTLLAADPARIAEAKAARRPLSSLKFPSDKARPVAPGISLFEGAWNVVLVDQPEGVYLIEAPISNSYASGAIAQARAGGRRLLGVVTTSDSWPHIGGLRQVVAERLPLIALDLNRPIIERLLAAPHRSQPDDLARKRHSAKFRTISTPATIGSGANAMRLIPFRTVTGERQMAIYWPAHRLLYASDIMQLQNGGIWLPQYRDEVAELIEREKLDVVTVFAMHFPPTPWKSLQALQAPMPR